MPEFLLRVLLAAIIAIVGAFATYTWSKSQRVTVAPQTQLPLARITSLANEVQRRPDKRLIWQHVRANQELYPGEGVRTASDAEATIEFIDKAVTVHLEPDSVIEIEESDGGINFDFLKGDMHIVAQTADTAITVKSGDQKVDMSGGEVQLSKASAKGPLAVDVIKGQPKLIEKGAAKPLQERRLRVTRPRPGEVVTITPGANDVVSFRWQAVDSSYDVTLETGETRMNLAPVMAVRAGSLTDPRLDVPLKPGKHYFRLRAKSRRPEFPELTSSTGRVDVRAKAPTVLAVAPSTALETSTLTAPPPPLPPPRPLAPENQAQLSVLQVQKGVELRWEPVPGAEAYEVAWLRTPLEQKANDAQESPRTQRVTRANLLVEDIKPGTYSWSVRAVDGKGATGERSPTMRFIAEGLKALSWTDGLTNVKQIYKTPKPILRLAWERGTAAAKRWRVRVGTSRDPASESEWMPLAKPEVMKVMEGPGTYYAEAEALDAEGAVIARTALRTQSFEPAPLSPAPEFLAKAGSVIQGNDDGAVEFAWKPVAETREYNLVLKTKKGETIRSQKVNATKITLLRVPTGEYVATVQAIDSAGRPGRESATRDVKVPQYSDVGAPKLKRVKVK